MIYHKNRYYLINGKVTQKYLWLDLTTLLAILDKDGNIIQKYEYANQRLPIALIDKDNNKYYLHYDQVGSLRAISDSSGNIIKEIEYDSFGNVLLDSNPDFKVPFGFAGGLYDEDTKLTHFGYRDYDPYTGKWTAKDPILFAGGDSNLYGYVLENPVNAIDELGLCVSSNAPAYEKIAYGVCEKGSTADAINHYFYGHGKPMDLGNKAKELLRNSTPVQNQLNLLKQGKAKYLNGNLNVNLTYDIFHIGDTGVVFNTYCNKKTCTTYFTGFVQAGNGGSCATVPDSFSDPLDIGIELPNGTPYYYIPYSWQVTYPNKYK